MVFPLISLNYLSASPDYFPASLRNTSLSEIGLIPLAISSSHDDSYMHAIQAYDANNNEPLIPPQVPIVSPTTLPPSPVLSPMFDFFIPEEILPPRELSHFRSSSSTNPPAQPQAIEIGENYHGALDTSYARHEEQIKDILNHLDALSLDHIEEMKDKIEAQAVDMANTDNTNRNPEPRETPTARKCTYKEFMSCQPFYFNATVPEDCKVKFTTGTLTEDALSWWNSYAKPIGIEQADKIAWTELKKLLTNNYCHRTEVKKMEDEFYNLVVKGNDLKTYARRF
nr:hypothetical protein [Tanacetum cinerariifolium]